MNVRKSTPKPQLTDSKFGNPKKDLISSDDIIAKEILNKLAGTLSPAITRHLILSFDCMNNNIKNKMK